MPGERKTSEGKCFRSFGRLLGKATFLFSVLSPPKCVEDYSDRAVQ